MIINIQAFKKDAGDIEDHATLSDEQRKKLNIIHQELDKMMGRPIEFIQQVRPVVVIDEPQSVDTTAKAKGAIKTLNPLFALRYSATHKNPYNLLYELGPVQADEVMKEQIRQTVEEHFKKERNLLKQGVSVKVLSLFNS